MAEIVWSERALNDLEVIGEYIALDSIRYAEATVKLLFGRTQVLSKSPKIGRVVPEFGNENLRELIEGSYRIVYRINPECTIIEMVTVHHSKMQFPSSFG